ncbi:MAG: hypothetical protein R6X13_00415, partial [bacterium]
MQNRLLIATCLVVLAGAALGAGLADLSSPVLAPDRTVKQVPFGKLDNSARPTSAPKLEIDRAGGPDGFGYVYKDETEPGGPTYAWIDTVGAINTNITGDDSYGTVTIPFTFSYYGNAYTTIYPCTNGWAGLSGSGTGYYNEGYPLPTTYLPAVSVCAMFDDLYVDGTTGNIFYKTTGTAPNRKFAIIWQNVRRLGGTALMDFEIVLAETENSITFQYADLATENGVYATVGQQGATSGTNYLVYSHLMGYLQNSRAIKFWVAPTLPNDVGITDAYIAQPYTSVQGQPQTVTATIRNYGSSVMSSIPLFYNGGAGNVNETWTGTLNPGASTSYTFTAPWTPAAPGGIAFTCATAVVGDPDTTNNRFNTSVPVFVTGTKVGQLFNRSTFPPPGWRAQILTGTYNWQLFSSGTLPTCAPLEGAGMTGFLSWSTSDGVARLVAHPFSVGASPENLFCRFFMYGDPGYSTSDDRVIVEYSTDSMATWNVVDSFSRYNAVAGWYQKNVELGMAAANARVFVGFRAVSEYGNNMYVDSIRIRYELPVANDIALDAILEPARFYSNTDVTPVVRIKNRGTASQSAIPVYVTADSAGTVIYSANATYAGPLAAGDTASVAMSTSFHVGGKGPLYGVTAWSALSGDQNPSNDTARVTGLASGAPNRYFKQEWSWTSPRTTGGCYGVTGVQDSLVWVNLG